MNICFSAPDTSNFREDSFNVTLPNLTMVILYEVVHLNVDLGTSVVNCIFEYSEDQ